MYFWIHNNIKNSYIKINLMGIISFWKSFIKHIKRKSPLWMILNQLRGIIMCFKQLIIGR